MRRIKPLEYKFIAMALDRAGVNQEMLSLSNEIRVEEMDDGGMGSLRFCHPNVDYVPKFGLAVMQGEFTDSDGIPVSFTLNVDQNGLLYELDMWKVNFAPLRDFPIKAVDVRINFTDRRANCIR